MSATDKSDQTARLELRAPVKQVPGPVRPVSEPPSYSTIEGNSANINIVKTNIIAGREKLKDDLFIKRQEFVANLDAKNCDKFDEIILKSPLGKAYAEAVGVDFPQKGDLELSMKAPRLWKNRTTGRKCSPIDFIMANYGHINSDNSWTNLGLTRDILAKIDPPLSNAYKKAISRNPERALPGLPLQEVVHIDDPVKALERRKEQERTASARYREKFRPAI